MFNNQARAIHAAEADRVKAGGGLTSAGLGRPRLGGVFAPHALEIAPKIKGVGIGLSGNSVTPRLPSFGRRKYYGE